MSNSTNFLQSVYEKEDKIRQRKLNHLFLTTCNKKP